jgi:hypothetical protein
MTPEIQKVPDLTKPPPLSLTNSTSSIPESPHLLPKRESSTPQLLLQKHQTKTLSLNPESKNDKSLDLTLLKPSHLLQNKRPKAIANPPEPTISSHIFESKPVKQIEKIEILPSSERLQQEINIKRVPHVDVVVEPISVKREKFKPKKNSDKPDLPSQTNSIMLTSSSPKPIWYNEPFDPSKNVTDQSKISKKRRLEMTANTTESTMNPGRPKNKPETSAEKYQTEENSKKPQNVNSSINSQSIIVKPILLNSYLIKSNLPNEPVDSFKNAAGQSNTSKKPRPEMTANTTEPTMNPGMFKNKPETSSEKYQRDEKSTEAQNVNSSINSQSTTVKPILLNSYLIKSNLPNEPVDPSKNVADQSKTSKNPRPEMTANTTEPTTNPGMLKNKPETSSVKYQTEDNSKEPEDVNSSINSQSTTVKPILLNSYFIKSNLPNEPVDFSKNVADQSNTSKKPRPEMTANTTEPTMNPGMSKNKPETSSEKYQTEENSKEPQNVNYSINSQSTTIKPIILNSYLIKSNLPNESVDSSKNVADQSNTSKKPQPKMTANAREPTMNLGMSKNKPETSSEKSQTEENSKEKQIVNSSINSQSTIVKPILLNSYLIKSNLPNEPVDSFKNAAGQSNTSKKPRPEMTANTTEPTMNPGMFKNKPETSSEKYQREEKSTEAQNVNSSINSQSTTVKPILLNSYLIKSNLPNEPVDSSKNVADQSNTSKKLRPEMIANAREPSMDTGMSKNKPETSSEKYQREEKSTEAQNVNSSINSQSTTVKPILLNSNLIKSTLPNEPVDSSKNVADQSNTSKKPRPEIIANAREPSMDMGMSKNKPETSSEKYQTEENSKEPQNVNSSINSQSTIVKPILLNSYLIKSNLPNEPVDSFKNAAGQSNTSKKPRPEMTANTTEPTMNPGMFKNKPETSSEKYQREEKSTEAQNVNSSINSQSTTVKPILVNSNLIKSTLPNEPVDSSKNVADQSNTSKKPRPEMIANTREPSMDTGMSKNKPETSSEKYQTEENSKEPQNVNSSINSQSTIVKTILLNSYLIKSNLPNEPVDSFKNTADQSNTSKKLRPEMIANAREPSMDTGMSKNKPETSSEKYQREESKEAQNVNSSINSQSTTVKPILLNSYLIKSNLPNEPVDSFKNAAGQSNTSKKPRPEMTANTTEPTMNPGMFKNKPETSSEKYQREEKSTEAQNGNSSINSQSTTVKPILLNSYLIKSNLPNEPVDSSKNVADQSNTSKKPRPKMIANTREPTMNTGMSKNKPETSSENFQTEKNSKEPQDVNSSINSQSTTVKPIFLNTYFIKPIPSNEPVDPFNNVAEPSKASEKQEPATSSERYKSTTNFNNPLMTTSPQLLFDSESTELDALSLLIAKLVADFKNLRSLPDYEKSQLVVDSDNQQPVVRSSISPPVVDSEDSQPEFDSGIPQPVVTSSSPQPVVDFESPQLVAYSEIPQPVVVSGTPHPALTSSIPHTVIDSGISQPVVDPGTPQPGVVSGTQQPAVASSNPQPAVDSETPQSVVDSGTQQTAVAPSMPQSVVDPGTPQPVVDSGTQQPAVVSSIPQPIVDSEIPQFVIDTGTPQSIVNYGTQQIAVASSTPQPAVDSETPQSVVDPGTQQPAVASSNLQLAIDSRTPQSAVDSGTQQSVVDSGTQKPAVVSSISQPIMDSEIPQLVIDPGTPQPIVESGTQQPAVASSTPQFAVDSETPQSVVDSGTQQPAVASSNLQLPVDSGTPQSAIDSGTQQSVVDSGTPQPEVVSGTPQPALTSSFPHTPIDSGIPQPVVDPGTQQPAVVSSIPRPIVNSEIPQLVIDHGTPQSIVNYGTQQPAVASSTPQFTVDSGTTQSVVDSGTQQPAVVSSIPQPVVDSEIPQLAIDPVTPQSIVNSGTQQAAVASSTPQPAVDSGTPQSSAVDSGTQQPSVVSSISQPILDSEIPQLVIDPGTPQLIAVAFSISQPAVDFGTSQSVDDSGTQQPSVAASISQPVLDSGTQQPVVDSGTQQTAVASSTLQSVVDSGTQKSSVASLNPQAVLDSGTQLSVVNSGTQQPSVAFSIPQTVLDSGTPLSVFDSGTQQSSVASSIPQPLGDSGTPQSVDDSGTQQPAVAYSIPQPVVDSGTQQPAVDSGTPQSVVDSGTQQPAVASSTPQFTVDSGTTQSVVDSGTQQPAVVSSIPQPIVDSEIPQLAIDPVTPQSIVNSGTQQAAVAHSDKSQPGGSKGPQQIIHSDKSQLGADSKGPQQSDKSQSGVDSKGPQQSPHSDKSEPGGSKESQKSPHSDKSKPGLGPNGSPHSTHSDKSEPPGNSRESKPSPGLKKPAKPSSSGELIN